MSAPSVFVTHVEANVKKGVNCDLRRLTLLVGPNGSGKTSVQNAIELAACGYASDVEGRVRVKKGDMLAKLGPASVVPLSADITLSDGRTAKWKLTPNKRGGYKEPEHTPPLGLNVIFPVQEVREIMGGSTDTVRMWLMSRVGTGVSEADVVERLPDDLQELYKSRSKKLRRADLTEVDVLLAAIENAESEARTLSAESKAGQQVIDTMGEGLGEEPSASDIEAAEEEVNQAEQRYRDAAQAASQPRPDVNSARSAALQAVESYKAAAETARLAQAAVPPMHQAEEMLIDFRGKMADICAVTVNLGARNCLVCDSPLNVSLASRSALLRKENEAGAAAVVAKRLAERKQAEAETVKSQAEKLILYFQQLEQQASQMPASEPVDLAAMGDHVVFLRSNVSNMKMQKRQWANIRAARDQVRRNGEAAGKLKDFANGCGEVVEALLIRAQKKFEALVQSHLPATDKFALVLTENKKPVCRLGFRRGKTLHTALSGAEWARLTLALGCATFKPDASTLAIFTPEERAFDPFTLSAVMNALENAPGQVILQSPNHPAEGYGKAWLVVDLAEQDALREAEGLRSPSELPQVVGEA